MAHRMDSELESSSASHSGIARSTGIEALETPKRRVSSGVRWAFTGLVVVFGAWVGLRVQGAMTAQAQVAQTRVTVAKAAAEAAGRPRQVAVRRGETAKWSPQVPLEGTLHPVREADLGFKAGGRIATVQVKVGDSIKAGRPLGTLDASEARAQLAAAEAQAKAAAAQVAVASDAERRTTALVESGGVAEATGVQAANQKSLAAAQLEAAQAQVLLARVNVENHALAAPFSGIVTRVPSGPGAVVGSGVPQFHLSDLSTLKLVGTVSERDASLVEPGSVVNIDFEGGNVHGKVTSVLSTVDPSTRRVPVEAEIAPENRRLLSGSFVRARISGGAPVDVLRIPSTALRSGSQDEVFVVQGDQLKVRRIAFSTDSDGTLLVRSGLAPTDDVVLDATTEGKEGERVQVVR